VAVVDDLCLDRVDSAFAKVTAALLPRMKRGCYVLSRTR